MPTKVRRYDSPDMARFPRGQDVASSGRLGTWAQDASGTRVGPAGTKIGPAPLTGACSEPATWFLRHHPDGQRLLAHVETTHGTGHALTILAHQLARAVSSMRKRKTAFALDRFLRT
jgi:hypothetical protein